MVSPGLHRGQRGSVPMPRAHRAPCHCHVLKGREKKYSCSDLLIDTQGIPPPIVLIATKTERIRYICSLTTLWAQIPNGRYPYRNQQFQRSYPLTKSFKALVTICPWCQMQGMPVRPSKKDAPTGVYRSHPRFVQAYGTLCWDAGKSYGNLLCSFPFKHERSIYRSLGKVPQVCCISISMTIGLWSLFIPIDKVIASVSWISSSLPRGAARPQQS